MISDESDCRIKNSSNATTGTKPAGTILKMLMGEEIYDTTGEMGREVANNEEDAWMTTTARSSVLTT